jgi:hypothetical protein
MYPRQRPHMPSTPRKPGRLRVVLHHTPRRGSDGLCVAVAIALVAIDSNPVMLSLSEQE